MSKKRLFQVLDEMNLDDTKNKTHMVTLHPDVVSVNQVKAGVHVTIGVPHGVIDVINQSSEKPKKRLVLMTVDGEELDKRLNATEPQPVDYEPGKGRSTKHNSRCLSKAADDEPIFVLRAKDPTAPSVIRAWVNVNQGLQPAEKLSTALELADEMDAWRIEKELTKPDGAQ